ncbi:MAG: flagellar protein FliT [Betaproteobacteria bacterium]|nr:MAG: flagellar protein FliT [Betaproteobacteria bacterium]
MNGSEIITTYEAILITTGQMLKVVQRADWRNLIVLEQECRNLIQKIIINDESKMLSDELRQRKLEIIQQILAVDAEIRTFTQPWTVQLQIILRNTIREHRLT